MSLASLPFDGVAGLVRDLVDRFVPDPQKKLEALQHAQDQQLQLLREGTFADKSELQMALGQVETNKVEADSPSTFSSGWRPFIGWVCGAGFAVQFVVAPLAEWVANLSGHSIKFPPLDLATMMPLLAGMLGLGTLRTYEKAKGVA